MKILELHVGEFGCLKDVHLTLDSGLNVLEGKNEAGKSTLWLFIKFMLYGLPRKGQEERDRSVSRDGHCAKGRMRVLSEGEEYLIERSFVEGSRSGTEHLEIRRCRDGEEVFRGINPGEALLGVPREVFESSCGIGQGSGSALGGKKGVEAIRNLLSTADEQVDIRKIEEKLDRIRVAYRHKSGKGGQLLEMSQELAQLKQRHTEAIGARARLETLQRKLAEGEAQAEQLKKEQKEAGQLLTQIGFYQILQRFDQLEENKRQLARLQQERQRLHSAELKTECFPTVSDVATLQSVADQVDIAEKRLRENQGRKDALVQTNLCDEQKAAVGRIIGEQGGVILLKERMRRLIARKKGLAIGGAALLAVGILLGLLLPLSTALRIAVAGGIAGASLLLLLLSAATGGRAKRMAAELGTVPSAFSEYVDSCEKEKQAEAKRTGELLEIESELRLAREYLQEGLSKLTKAVSRTAPQKENTVTVALAREEARRLSEFLRADGELSRRAEVLERGIRGECAHLAGYDAAALREQVGDRVAEMTSDQIRRAETNREMLQHRLEALESSLKQTRIEVISLNAGAEDPLALADEIAKKTEAKNRATEYADSVELALSAIRQAADAMSGSITPALSEMAGAMMERISQGRYGELKASKDLLPTLFTEDRQSVPEELMSGGTKDAAYLCLRIALMTQVFTGELPPLMMDETLCQMDDERVRRMMKLLSDLCSDGLQCLLFTCHSREGDLCDRQDLPCRRILL